MDSFLNHLRGQSAQLDQGWAQPRLGVVSSVNAANYTARVLLQPENVLSGWLPIGSSWVGGGWGLACLPNAGDQVLIIWQEGNPEHGIIVCRLWSTTLSAPTIPVGELWMVHQSGSYLKLQNDGSIASSAGTWSHHGSLQVSGDVSDNHGSLASLRGHYNEHVHAPGDTPPSPID